MRHDKPATVQIQPKMDGQMVVVGPWDPALAKQWGGAATVVSRGRFRRPERATLGHTQKHIEILAVRLISRETTGNNVRRFSFTLIRKRLPSVPVA